MDVIFNLSLDIHHTVRVGLAIINTSESKTHELDEKRTICSCKS
jgi:hypothetical protein